jgi:hypothetical protein
MSTSKKSKLIYGFIITMSVLLFIGLLTVLISYQDLLIKKEFKFSIFSYSLFDYIFYMVIPLTLGGIVYTAAIHTNEWIKETNFTLAVAVINFFLCLFEAICIFNVFTLGGFQYLNIYFTFIVFGYFIFRYPRDLFKSVVQLALTTVLPLLWTYFKHEKVDIINYMFTSGYVITSVVILSMFLLLLKYAIQQKEMPEDNKMFKKYLVVILVLYFVFALIPAGIDYYSSFYLYASEKNALVDMGIFTFLVLSQSVVFIM